MLDICANADEALVDLALARGLISAPLAAELRVSRRGRSAAVALVEDGHLGAAEVRALRMIRRRTTIDNAWL